MFSLGSLYPHTARFSGLPFRLPLAPSLLTGNPFPLAFLGLNNPVKLDGCFYPWSVVQLMSVSFDPHNCQNEALLYGVIVVLSSVASVLSISLRPRGP